ncbi:rhamnan synthesis F family protein [Kluyvera genomosp. 1]|uniref:rhamnan synthesis F family protein n=1 Tax=Kluyvera genomosp. 1 TaxID=2774053 RepID=UPI00068A0EAD|nr:rhamnan synthesis F family protein [Kluyvera genomosp. 1]
MRKICLFAGYNSKEVVQQYVFDYLAELNKYADVYYLSDGELSIGDIAKLKEVCKNVWGFKHGKYDFGSYSELAKNLVGWDEISKYDELIFANDSCFPIQSFEPVFNEMDSRITVDSWALLSTDEYNNDHLYTLKEYAKIPTKKIPYFCMGSYFICFRKNVINDLEFREFINSVKKEENRIDVCLKYEMGLTQFLIKKHFEIDCFVDVVYRGASIYAEPALRLVKYKFPLVKCRIFTDNPMGVKNVTQWIELINLYTNGKLDLYIDGKDKLLGIDRGKRRNIRNNILPPIFSNGLKYFIKQFTPPVIYPLYWVLKDAFRNKNMMSALWTEIYLRLSKKNNLTSDITTAKHLVVYFNVARDTIGGGMLSINRFVYFSRELEQGFNFKVIMSGLPLINKPVEYSLFRQASPMIHFFDIINNTSPDKLTLNIPEYYLPDFIYKLDSAKYAWLKGIPFLHINILDQNHDYAPSQADIEFCRELTDNVTFTTAHERYTTQEVSEHYNCPVKLLTPFLPTFYKTEFKNKKKQIVLSQDVGPNLSGLTKNDLILKFETELPDYSITIVDNIGLDEYKRLISDSLFTITFGEGYDGYFIEPFLSNSVSFAVYNDVFFPSEFENCSTVYSSWQDLFDNIVADVKKYEASESLYRNVINETTPLIYKFTNDEKSLGNLIDYYSGVYDFYPSIHQRFKKYNPQPTQVDVDIDFTKTDVP